MNKLGTRLALLLLFLTIACNSSSQSFHDYVHLCKQQLGFDTIPRMDCRGVNFRKPIPNTQFDVSNDWVAHRRINNSVDVVFACRWVFENEGESGAVTGEMIVHNRKTGGTCFFEMENISTTNAVSRIKTTNPVSPTDRGASHFWGTATFCTKCHSAGPYIASPQIVGALAKFGLINDGHDTFSNFYHAIEPEFAISKMGEVYFYNPVLNNKIDNSYRGCAGPCHVLNNANVNSTANIGGSIILPSINLITDDVIVNGHMPPNDPYSDYRWINRDDPGATGDWEQIHNVENEYPHFHCSNPKRMQAHRVDSSIILNTNDLPDKVRTFNLYDGLICHNKDQSSGKRCADYSTRYRCNGKWTDWQSTDKPTSALDNEARSRFKGLCSNPSHIQAKFTVSGKTKTVYGPNDRLAQFNNKGLVCRNKDQPDGKCNNYVVRFICD